MFDLTGSGAEPLRPDDPAHIGGIRLAGRLGTGGMGRVFLGVHEGRYVAVKQVLPSVMRRGPGLRPPLRPRAGQPLPAAPGGHRPPARQRPRRPSPWLATAYVPGLTLSDAVRLHQGPLPAEAVWLLLREAAAGLVPVHGLGMVHRDLKPSNVMLTVEGATVIDFGVARATEQSQLTRSGVVVGTPAYMAPEQAVTRRDLTGAVDVFALGSVIAYAAGGNPPFGEESGPAVLYRIVHEEPDLEAVRELDPALADLVTACLAKDPEARPTAAELVRRATEHGPSTAPLWPDSFSADLAAKAAFAAPVQEPGPPPPSPSRRSTWAGRPTRSLPPSAAAAPASSSPSSPSSSRAARPSPSSCSLTSPTPTTPPAPPPPSAPRPPPPRARARPARPPPQRPPRTRRRRRTRRKMRTGTRKTRTPTRAQARERLGERSRCPRHRGQGQRFRRLRRLQLLRRRWRLRPHRRPRRGRQAPSGAHRYRNGENAKCLAAPFNSPPTTAACNGSGTVWAFRPLSDGSFEIVHESGRSCLSSGAGGTLLLSCNQAESRRWRTGPEGTLKSVGTGGCLGTVNGSRITTTQCTGSPSQRWTAT